MDSEQVYRTPSIFAFVLCSSLVQNIPFLSLFLFLPLCGYSIFVPTPLFSSSSLYKKQHVFSWAIRVALYRPRLWLWLHLTWTSTLTLTKTCLLWTLYQAALQDTAEHQIEILLRREKNVELRSRSNSSCPRHFRLSSCDPPSNSVCKPTEESTHPVEQDPKEQDYFLKKHPEGRIWHDRLSTHWSAHTKETKNVHAENTITVF